MRAGGVRLKTVTITAKEKTCFRPEGECDPEECPYARGYYDRVAVATRDIFACDAWTRPVIEEYAQKHTVCPFEFSLDLSLWADCIVGDYNYVFDPRVYLRRFFAEEVVDEGNYCFLIDEAHNLVDRAREMFSAGLTRAVFEGLRKQVKPARTKKSLLAPRSRRLLDALAKIIAWFKDAGLLCEEKTGYGEGGAAWRADDRPPENDPER
jgi:DNA excision repair protein ERCC-2